MDNPCAPIDLEKSTSNDRYPDRAVVVLFNVRRWDISGNASKSVRLIGMRIKRLFENSASDFIRSINLWKGSFVESRVLRIGSFVESLAGFCEWIEWLIRTRFPSAKLTLVNAFARLVKRKSAKSTTNFERAAVALFIFNRSHQVVVLKAMGLINCEDLECFAWDQVGWMHEGWASRWGCKA